MRTSLLPASLIVLSFAALASAHRLDEYLQATTFSLEEDRVQAQIRLTPGVAVSSFVIAIIDTDGDGLLSTREQRSYADRVLGDLSLAVDGHRLSMRMISMKFPELDAMKEGLGEIKIDFVANVPRSSLQRKLVFENHHQKAISTYLANCLTPQHPGIQIRAQARNYEQSRYQLEYVQNTRQMGVASSKQSARSERD